MKQLGWHVWEIGISIKEVPRYDRGVGSTGPQISGAEPVVRLCVGRFSGAELKCDFRKYSAAAIRSCWPVSTSGRRAGNPDGFRTPDGLIRDFDQLRMILGLRANQLQYSKNKFDRAQALVTYSRTLRKPAEVYAQSAQFSLASLPPPPPPPPVPEGAEGAGIMTIQLRRIPTTTGAPRRHAAVIGGEIRAPRRGTTDGTRRTDAVNGDQKRGRL